MSHMITSGSSATKEKIRVSPSAKAIFKLLEKKKTALPVKDIVRELPYSERTIQYGLKLLTQHKLVEKKANLQDLRESLYVLATTAMLYRIM